jgi:hypothetical protein
MRQHIARQLVPAPQQAREPAQKLLISQRLQTTSNRHSPEIARQFLSSAFALAALFSHQTRFQSTRDQKDFAPRNNRLPAPSFRLLVVQRLTASDFSSTQFDVRREKSALRSACAKRRASPRVSWPSIARRCRSSCSRATQHASHASPYSSRVGCTWQTNPRDTHARAVSRSARPSPVHRSSPLKRSSIGLQLLLFGDTLRPNRELPGNRGRRR